jgi:hypothetical protein
MRVTGSPPPEVRLSGDKEKARIKRAFLRALWRSTEINTK